MPAPVIRKLPTPPNRHNAPAVFAERADAFLGALPQLGEDIDASAAFVNEQAAAADTSAQAAKASENAAAQSRTTAAQSAAASEASRQSALAIAAAVGDDAGLPAISGKPGAFLMVNRYGTGVEFGSNTATQGEAEEGLSDEVLMTPHAVMHAIGALGVQAYVDEFTTSGTWVKRPDALLVIVEMLGAGQGGGAGYGYYTETGGFFSAGGVGGAGGSYSKSLFVADDLPESVQVSIGSGSIGAVGGGVAPSSGGNTMFGPHLAALGGGQAEVVAVNEAGAKGGYGSNYNYVSQPSAPVQGNWSRFAGGGGGGGGMRALSAGASGGGRAVALGIVPTPTGPAGGAIGSALPGANGGFGQGGGGGAGGPNTGVGGNGGNGGVGGGGGGGGAGLPASSSSISHSRGGNGGNGWARVITIVRRVPK